MKKRLMSILLTLCMLITMLPTTAWAADQEGPVTVNGDISIEGKGWNFKKDGSPYKPVYYNFQGNFIEDLEKWGSNPYLELTREGNTITVTVHGNVSLSTEKDTSKNDQGKECIGVNKSFSSYELNLIITGAADGNNTLSLTSKGFGYTLSSYQGDVTFTGGITVNVESTYNGDYSRNTISRGINVSKGDLIISGDGTSVTATNAATDTTVNTVNALKVSGGAELIATNNNRDGKALSFGSIAVNSGYDYMEKDTTSSYKTLPTEGRDEAIKNYRRIKIAPTTIVTADDVYIAGEKAVVGVETSLGEGNGTYLYDATTRTLKLNNVNITAANSAAIRIFDGYPDCTIVVTGTNKLQGNYNHCIESYSNFTISGDGTLEMTNGKTTAASVIYCGPYKSLSIGAEVILRNDRNAGNLIFTVKDNAYSFADGYNIYASTNSTGEPLEEYSSAKYSSYQYLRATKETLPTGSETTYDVTITADNVTVSGGALTQTVKAGEAMTPVILTAKEGYIFRDGYYTGKNGVSITRDSATQLTISGTPSADATLSINGPIPYVVVTLPAPVAGDVPATSATLSSPVYSNIQFVKIKWYSFDGVSKITPLSSGDKFVEGKKYCANITFTPAIASANYLLIDENGNKPWYAEWDSSYFSWFFDDAPAATHTHTYDDAIWTTDDNNHWHQCTDPNCPNKIGSIKDSAAHNYVNGACTICGKAGGTTEEHHFDTAWSYDSTDHWHKCTDEGCDAVSDKAPHEWVGWRVDEPYGTHQRFCNCGYRDYGHTYHLAYAADGENGHYQYCTTGNCTYQTSTVPHNYDGDTCTICGYTKTGGGEIVPPTPGGTIVIIVPAEEEPAPRPNPSTGALTTVAALTVATITRH